MLTQGSRLSAECVGMVQRESNAGATGGAAGKQGSNPLLFVDRFVPTSCLLHLRLADPVQHAISARGVPSHHVTLFCKPVLESLHIEGLVLRPILQVGIPPICVTHWPLLSGDRLNRSAQVWRAIAPVTVHLHIMYT